MELWLTVMVTDVLQADVRVIVPVRAPPVLDVTDTTMLLLFDPDGGVTATQDKDSETVQLELEVIFTE
ncbi:MAG: hypothetical protein FD155_1793 [Bacteroidetes bacterium]|nr:MAG: hypothetical protein FD155_1793 [Bacteroidota bacterium]